MSKKLAKLTFSTIISVMFSTCEVFSVLNLKFCKFKYIIIYSEYSKLAIDYLVY